MSCLVTGVGVGVDGEDERPMGKKSMMDTGTIPPRWPWGLGNTMDCGDPHVGAGRKISLASQILSPNLSSLHCAQDSGELCTL